MSREEPVIVAVNGVPSFQLAPSEEKDDLIDRPLKDNPKFGQILKQRSRERTVSLDQARKRL